MNTLEGFPMHAHYKKLLATGQKKYAWKILQEFFEAFGEEGPQETLWFMLCAAMKLESEEIDGKQRSNLLFFYDYAVTAFEAANALRHHHSGKKED